MTDNSHLKLFLQGTSSMQKINALKKDHTAISFFSGCGGSSTGYKLAKFKMLFASEFIPEAVKTYRANHPKTIVDPKDIRDLDPHDILKRIGLKVGELDLLDGSPPCSDFSAVGIKEKGWGKERKYSDTVQRSDDLFEEYIRMVRVIQPKVFVAENVTGLVQGNSAKQYCKFVIDELHACGYAVSAAILNAATLDVPQTRRRLIFIGVRNDLVKLGFKPVFPKENDYMIKISEIMPHIIGIRNSKKFSYGSSQTPFPTIVAGDGSNSETAKFSSGGFVQLKSGETRKLTIDELKKCCSFPQDFIITGTLHQQWERMGNAVPPLMTYHIAKTLRDKILIPYKKMCNLKTPVKR
jgi:DNA (cytosine-5)-methyltransferase 1